MSKESLDELVVLHLGRVGLLQGKLSQYRAFPDVVESLCKTYRREVQALYDLDQHALAKVSLQYLERRGWEG